MDTILSRHRNLTILAAALTVQAVMLAVQVKRPTSSGPTRLIRVWAVGAITPLERGAIGAQRSLGNFWQDYVWLRGARRDNAELREQMERMRLEQIRLVQDAAQA